MAWCPACTRYLTPTSLQPDGTCPYCKQIVDYTRNRKVEAAKARGEEVEETVPVPWHFKLLLVATVVYLGWRAMQGVEWLVHHFG